MSQNSSESAFTKLTQIIQSAAKANTIEAQVQHIVEAISETLLVDVCSLYLRQPDDSLRLVASRGLIRNHPVVIPSKQGLVGQVMQQQNTINIKDPDQHPGYFYVANSEEEQFHSFCGVPLVYRAQVNGVLVAQSRRAELLPSDHVALFSTLATHLAMLIATYSKDLFVSPSEAKLYQGISGAQGVALGKAFIRKESGLAEIQKLKTDDVGTEQTRWVSLKAEAMNELREERDTVCSTLGEGLASVLDAYQMLLKDATFEQRIMDEVAQGYQLPWAIRQAVSFFSDKFKEMDDPYLRARHEDIEQLGAKLYQIWQRTSEPQAPAGNEPLILVGDQISVSDIVNLATDRLAGIVCFGGGSLSHIAVFANALGIPAVMGLGEVSVQNSEQVVVDGDAGQVICSPAKSALREYKRIISERQTLANRLQADSQLPAVTKDNVRVTLLANSGLQADVLPGLRFGAEGIGLFRTEVPFMVRSSLPSEDDQEKIYRSLISHYKDKPIYFRTLDIGADKPLSYLPLVKEENPALGWRGIRYILDNQPLLITQLRAFMKAAAGSRHVHLMLPMIASTEQLDQCLAILNEVHHQLVAEGVQVCRPKVGIMVEVPSCIALLPFWRDKLDFISIGTNDLSQYLLALDRNSPLVGKWYDSLHPAVIHELLRISTMAKQMNLPVSVCGEMASDPVAVILLLGMGIQQLSMSAAKIPLIKWILRSITREQAGELLAEALQQDNASAIRQLGQQFLASKQLLFNETTPK
ncbi:phosphoenolpyruvate--protein phosphotransferase [Amphritea pacifica]|uniref:phosphoenolpyruvate--protein phosphotransferase n=1 Tax=Amphritea pacifica TaxID=2811233 RepID=A0ABS2W3K2_9GAMM|nr:phosphoenolpyruvate--protein phosphotransferase [Amphritea pacifica]MBN0986300.1 phosphoenolpyruvate--protein phosphotransferase [Amphritea pacifica]MBN1006991.1 phosphoenolpyruvate--protein phosphotransferase [Amphritea pacifica]